MGARTSGGRPLGTTSHPSSIFAPETGPALLVSISSDSEFYDLGGPARAEKPFRIGSPVTGPFFTHRADELDRIPRAFRERARILWPAPLVETMLGDDRIVELLPMGPVEPDHLARWIDSRLTGAGVEAVES
jgi:hypothetical protein